MMTGEVNPCKIGWSVGQRAMSHPKGYNKTGITPYSILIVALGMYDAEMIRFALLEV